jgi:holliday junction DNA helicase RuvB
MDLRPNSFNDFVGQYQAKNVLQVACAAAKQRGDVLSHTLLAGPSGLGKTSLALLLSREMNAPIKITSAPLLTKGDVITIARSLQRGSLWFCDEIHRLSGEVEECLYSILEDFRIDLVFGRNVRSIPVQRFCFVGATTKAGSISAPLRNRFPLALRLDYYTASEVSEILKRNAPRLNVELDGAASYVLAAASRGVPRLGNSLLLAARDLAQVRGSKTITCDIARGTLAALNIDANGLDGQDRRLLRTLRAAGRPIGLDALAASLDESPETVEASESFLLRSNFVLRTARGRMLTANGAAVI